MELFSHQNLLQEKIHEKPVEATKKLQETVWHSQIFFKNI